MENIITDCAYTSNQELEYGYGTGIYEICVSFCVNGRMIHGRKKIGQEVPTKADIQSCIMNRIDKELENIEFRRI